MRRLFFLVKLQGKKLSGLESAHFARVCFHRKGAKTQRFAKKCVFNFARLCVFPSLR
jgi:hypothetical protein